jgi:hypothetical protein
MKISAVETYPLVLPVREIYGGATASKIFSAQFQ